MNILYEDEKIIVYELPTGIMTKDKNSGFIISWEGNDTKSNMTEVRLIDANALKAEFMKEYPIAYNEMGGVINKRIYDIIDNAPTVKIPKSIEYLDGWDGEYYGEDC